MLGAIPLLIPDTPIFVNERKKEERKQRDEKEKQKIENKMLKYQ